MNKTILIILMVALLLGVTFAVTMTVSAALPGGGRDTSFCTCDGDRGWGADNNCPPLTSGQQSYCQRYA